MLVTPITIVIHEVLLEAIWLLFNFYRKRNRGDNSRQCHGGITLERVSVDLLQSILVDFQLLQAQWEISGNHLEKVPVQVQTLQHLQTLAHTRLLTGK